MDQKNKAKFRTIRKDFEDEILAFVQIKYPKAHRISGSFSAYDIIVPERRHTIECKFDRMSEQTGNIAIELIEICAFSKIKLGWAFKKFDELCYLNWYSKDIYRIPMKELKNMIFENPRKGFAALHKSPMNYFTLGILLPIEEIKKYKNI